jgi:hypothetical protein
LSELTSSLSASADQKPAAKTKTPEVPSTTSKKMVKKPKDHSSENKKKDDATDQKKEKPKKKKAKKLLITGAAAAVATIFVSTAASTQVLRPAKVDDQLVQDYLSAQSGQVQGAQTENETTTGLNQSPEERQVEQLRESAEEKISKVQQDISFETTEWETFNDAMFGILLEYPKNAVKIIKTDSSATFIRKTGYIFKIQRIETALELDEYWKQIKATSLEYQVEETSFKNMKALFLQLKDISNYPGNRYLIKSSDFIYDIWYASPSDKFTDDDIKRAKYMLDSVTITIEDV